MSYLYRFLDTNGDGTGTTNAVGNYASAAEEFYVQPATGYKHDIERMIVQIRDAGGFSADNYGGTSAVPLTNGVSVSVQDDSGTIADLTGGITIKSHADWGRVCYDVTYVSFGTGDNFVEVRWTFAKGGQPITLDGNRNERLVVTLNDSLTLLVGHYFMVQGVETAWSTIYM